MFLIDFVNKPCVVCSENNFTFSYCRKYKETDLEYNNGILYGHIYAINFSINSLKDTFSVDPPHSDAAADIVEPWLKFRLMKECAAGHYRTSTKFIDRCNDKLFTPDGVMYDDIHFRFDETSDDRVPEGGGSINFINNYDKNEMILMTPNGPKKFPIVPLDRFDLTDPVSVLNKLESLVILL